MLTKIHIIKSMSFPAVMYGCESWTIKKAEHRRTDAFELWCWRRLLDCVEINQSIQKEINPEYSLEGLMLKLNLQYFGHLIQRADLLEKTLMLGKIYRRCRGQEVLRWLDSITDSGHESEQTPGDRGGQECCSPWSCRVGHDLVNEQQ